MDRIERMTTPAPSGGATGRRLALMRDWTRLGALFNTAAATTRVDPEPLIVDTAAVARSDERLFVMVASWLAEHHHLVDARRLGRQLDGVDASTSATAGAMLAMAARDTTGATALQAAMTYCQPLVAPEPLFPVMARHPGLLALVRAETLPLFARWGFWHNDAALKRNAIRPIGWILQHCPELRIRALLGTGLDAEVIELVTAAPRTVAEIVRETGASYAAAHAAATRLRGRGLLARRADKAWTISPEAPGVVRAVLRAPRLQRRAAAR
jgi:hypothetical protein